MSYARRFKERTSIQGDGCWLWTGFVRSDGYARCYYASKHDYAHKVAFLLFRGVIPAGNFVCHACDVRHCVNPDHLFIGLPSDNVQDMVAKNRHVKGMRCPWRKLDESAVRQIRSLAASGFSQSELGRMFGIHQGSIWKLLRGITWKSVA